jgi:Hemerythrin HHE cation binding domain
VSSSKETPSAKELLAADHAALDELLKTLLVALDQGETSTIFQRLDLFWARLAMHIRAENLHLFPAILNHLDGPAPEENQSVSAVETRRALVQLRADHDFFMHELADAVKTVRNLKDLGTSDEGCCLEAVQSSIQAVSRRLESHNAIEEGFIYGLPIELLPPNEQFTLMKGIQRELQKLPPRFDDATTGVHSK